MKKTILMLIAGLLLAGCGPVTDNKGTTPETKPDVFTSIKEAITKSQPLKCDYVDEDGENTTVYFLGQTVKLVGAPKEGETFEGLIKSGKFYLWDTTTKQGMELDLSKMGEDGSLTMGEKQIKGIDDVVTILEEKKTNCSVVTAEAGMFEVPADIKFGNVGGT